MPSVDPSRPTDTRPRQDRPAGAFALGRASDPADRGDQAILGVVLLDQRGGDLLVDRVARQDVVAVDRLRLTAAVEALDRLLVAV